MAAVEKSSKMRLVAAASVCRPLNDEITHTIHLLSWPFSIIIVSIITVAAERILLCVKRVFLWKENAICRLVVQFARLSSKSQSEKWKKNLFFKSVSLLGFFFFEFWSSAGSSPGSSSTRRGALLCVKEPHLFYLINSLFFSEEDSRGFQ